MFKPDRIKIFFNTLKYFIEQMQRSFIAIVLDNSLLSPSHQQLSLLPSENETMENEIIPQLVDDVLQKILYYVSDCSHMMNFANVSKQWRRVIFQLPHLTITSKLLVSITSSFDVRLFPNISSLKMICKTKDSRMINDDENDFLDT